MAFFSCGGSGGGNQESTSTRCPPAFTDNGNGCEFSGAPLDPGFQASDIWVASNSVHGFIDIGAVGERDSGEGVIDADGVCELDYFSQTFTMPTWEQAGALLAVISFKQGPTMAQYDSLGAAVQIGESWNYIYGSSGSYYSAKSFCLGDAAYGGPVTFRIGPAKESSQCQYVRDATFHIDHFSIQKAKPGECPDQIGNAINSDMEDSTGWTFSASATDSMADFVDGVGVGGSRALRLVTTTDCAVAGATGMISLPTDATTPNSAIAFYTSGSSKLLELRLGGRVVSLFNGGGTRHVCVPDWAKGTTQSLYFSLGNYHSGADCQAVVNNEIIIDEVSVVSDSKCTASNNKYDNGMEVFFNSAVNTPGWAVINGGVNGAAAPATIVNDSNVAHSGIGSIMLTATDVCATPSASRDIIVPHSVDSAGPVISVFANFPSSPIGSGRVLIASGVGSDYGTSLAAVRSNVLEGVGYQLVTLCVPPRYSGRRVKVYLEGNGGFGGCQVIAPETGYFDDFYVGTYSGCPTQ